MKNSGYKPFLKYVHGVQFLLNAMHKKLPRFHLRLFIEDDLTHLPKFYMLTIPICKRYL